MNKLSVTVLIDTYNHERFIEEAIMSVLEQDFPAADMEILVVDDGSTDRTPEIVRKFKSRVRLIQKANGGQASAFNFGLPQAQGEIVAFLDGDDWWARNKLTRVAEAMSADPALGIVGHGIVMVQLDGRQQSETLCEGFRFRADTREGARLFRLRKSFLGTSRMTIRRKILEQIGAVPGELTIEADEYFFTLAAVLADARILPDALTFYRLHDANSFQFSRHDPAKAHRKLRALNALALSLSTELERAGIKAQVRRAITGIVQAEADQLRLSLDGGWPWETVKVEWTIDRVLHPNAAPGRHIFKALSLLPALVLPPRIFYEMRKNVARNRTYLRARDRWLPVEGHPATGKRPSV